MSGVYAILLEKDIRNRILWLVFPGYNMKLAKPCEIKVFAIKTVNSIEPMLTVCPSFFPE